MINHYLNARCAVKNPLWAS